MYDIPVILLDFNDDGVQDIPKFVKSSYVQGDFFDRIVKQAMDYEMGDEITQEIVSSMKSMFQEITKEEYESMITFKP